MQTADVVEQTYVRITETPSKGNSTASMNTISVLDGLI
jgi:hypothetical protein